MTERVAIVDLGSNSARLVIMDIYRNGAYNMIYNQKETVRLSEGLGEGEKAVLTPTTMQRAVDTLHVFSLMCKIMKADKILAVATAAVRGARNGQEFVNMVKEQTGIPLRIIDGREEAVLGYFGVINTIAVQDFLLFDLGGASTEITLIKDRLMAETVSLPLGAVNLTEKFDSKDRLTDDALTEMRSYIEMYLEKFPWIKNLSLPIVGVGGTVRSIAKMDRRLKDYPFPEMHNYRLGKMAVTEIWKNLIKTNFSQRQKISGLDSERADIILAGVTVVKSIFDISDGLNLIISGAGLRDGIFFNHYLKSKKQGEIIPDILMHSVWNGLTFYQGDAKHHLHVCNMAGTMFDAWQNLHKMGERQRELLKVAAMLHDIGISINYYEHARHSAYLVENARLYGLTHREQLMASVVAGWHEGYYSKYLNNKLYNEFLDQIDKQITRRMAVLLALAESLEITQMRLVKKIEPSFANGKAYLKIISDEPVTLELKAAAEHRKWFKKEFGVELIIE